jgi:hypothetical protein
LGAPTWCATEVLRNFVAHVDICHKNKYLSRDFYGARNMRHRKLKTCATDEGFPSSDPTNSHSMASLVGLYGHIVVLLVSSKTKLICVDKPRTLLPNLYRLTNVNYCAYIHIAIKEKNNI